MSWNDTINGVFESVGGVLCWKNFFVLWKDRELKGVYWPTTAFFAFWGLWNATAYYPSLGQWFSWAGGVFLATGNLAWVVLAVRLTLKMRRPKRDG